jgi:hypothetical protein
MLFANVIFPAPSAVYVSTLFVPLATVLALGTEFFIFCRTQQGVTSNKNLFGIVFVLNVFSWIVGLLVSGFFPSGLVPHLTPDGISTIQPGPHWNAIALLSFPFACIFSAALEYFGLRVFFRRLSFRSPLRTVAIANLASYIVLGAALLLLRV